MVFNSIAAGMGLDVDASSSFCEAKDHGRAATNETEENPEEVFDDSEEEDDYFDYNFYEEDQKDRLKVAVKLSQIICDMLYVDADEFDLDTEISELEDWGLDIYELMDEISSEMDVDLDFDEIIDCDRVYDLVGLIVENQEWG